MVTPSIVEAKFMRGQLSPTRTFLWKNFQPESKSELLNKSGGFCTGEPIIVFAESVNYMWILTTIELIIFSENINRIPYNNIGKVDLGDLFDGSSEKLTKDSLTLILKDKKRFDLKVEKLTWHLIYNIIKFLINSSR